MSRAMKFFDQAAKLVPVITAIAGATISAAGGYFAIQSDLTEARRHNEQTEAKLETHLSGWDHDNWFGDDWIRHPALRGCLERWLAREQAREDSAVHSCFAKSTDCESKWQRLFELNPSLSRPGSH